MIKDAPQIKPKTWLARLMLNCAIMTAFFQNPELMHYICGPFTLPVSDKPNLLCYIFVLQMVRVLFQPLMEVLRRLPGARLMPRHINELLIVKYVVVLLMKFLLIFEQSHRKKFYLHSFLLEGIILITAVLFDISQKNNIKEAGQLLLIEGLHRLSLVYELTQTFCPNLILYYAFSNLLVFVLAQVESQERYGLNQSLYVKHDVYRFLFMAALFFGLIAFAQLLSVNFYVLLVFIGCLKPLLTAIHDYQQNRFSRCSNWLLLCAVIVAGGQLLFIKMPFGGGEQQQSIL